MKPRPNRTFSTLLGIGIFLTYFSFQLSAQTLHLGNGQEPKSLDPGLATGITEINIINNLFEGLTTLDPYSLLPRPGIAESWEINGDKTVYTFTLRKNAKFSDGKAITAEDVVYSWKRVLNPATGAEYAYNLFPVKNAKKMLNGNLATNEKLGLEVKNHHTLVVTLESPTPHFLQLTAFATLMVVPRHVLDEKINIPWTKPERIVSSGPYTLEEWKMNTHVKLVRNNHYYQKPVGAAEAYFYPFESEQTEENAFRQGKLHLTYRVPVAKSMFYRKKFANKPYSPYKADPYLGTYYYRFNTTVEGLNKPEVRKALAMVIPKDILVERVTRGGEKEAASFTPPGLAGYQPPKVFEGMDQKTRDEKAVNLMTKAGFKDGKGFPKLTLLYNTSQKHKKIATAIQQVWNQKLNIKVGLLNQEWSVYLSRVNKMDYQIATSSWIADYPYPTTFLDIFRTERKGNDTGWISQEFDQQLDAAMRAQTEPERLGHYQKAEQLLLNAMPIAPVYHYSMQRLVAKNLRNLDMEGRMMEWTPNSLGLLYLRNFDIADE